MLFTFSASVSALYLLSYYVRLVLQSVDDWLISV